MRLSGFLLSLSLLFLFPPPALPYEGELAREEVKGNLETIRMNEIFNRYLATIEMYDPERATLLGLHESDALLTRRNKEQMSKMLTVFRKLREKLRKIDADALYPETRADLSVLDHMLQTDIYNIRNMDLLRKRPQYYLRPLFVIYAMLDRDYANYNLRASDALSRIKLFPKVLLEAERNLSNPPRIWTLDAIRRAEAAMDNISDFFFMLKSYSQFDPVLRTQVNDALTDMKAALERYRDFLKTEILPKSDGDFRVGRFTYGFYLERWHGLDITPRKALHMAKAAYKKARKELEKEARNIDPLVYDKSGWIGVWKKLPFEHPERGNILRTFQNEMERAYQHFDEFKVVRYPRERILIKEMPGFMLPQKPYVYYMPSFPLDDKPSADLYIALPPRKTPKKELDAVMKTAYNYSLIELLITHSVMPGLHLEYWESSQNPSKIRKISNQPFISAGWALYSENLAEEMGFYSLYYSRMVRLYFKTLRALRGYTDALLHQKKINYEKAVKMFMREMYFGRKRAESEILRISLNPTVNFGGVYVYDKILKLRKSQKKEEQKYFALRKFHTRFLSEGMVPFPLLREEMERKIKKSEKILK